MQKIRHQRAALLAAAVLVAAVAHPSRITAQIRVGINSRVSLADPESRYGEVVIASDPSNPRRILAAGMLYPAESNGAVTMVFRSSDGGLNWTKALEHRRRGPCLDGGADPTLAFGPDGSAYYAAISFMGKCGEIGPMVMSAYSSRDAGVTWVESEPIEYRRGVDRPFLVVDNSRSAYAGQVYIFGQLNLRPLDGIWRTTTQPPWEISVWRSVDNGRSFERDAGRVMDRATGWFAPGNAVVLSDGSVVGAYAAFDTAGAVMTWTPSRTLPRNAFIRAITSKDGGATLEPAVTVSGAHIDNGPSGSIIPAIAADTRGKVFRDRLYVVWSDGRSERTQILLSYSSDRGVTWSAPRPVSDDVRFANGSPGPDDFMPTVAVNNAGVVGVAWYDRREVPDNMGYTLRFAASLDGGDTFLPSVRISEAARVIDTGKTVRLKVVDQGAAVGAAPTQRFRIHTTMTPAVGHTAGLTADANGSFHPVWIDNRTGNDQIWTARVEVDGEPMKNGVAEVSKLDDLSSVTRLELVGIKYDRDSATITTDASVVNTGQQNITLPLRVRVVSLSSDIGELATTSDGKPVVPVGAIWQFSGDDAAASLAPGHRSASRRLIFRLKNVRPFVENGKINSEMLKLEVRVFGKAQRLVNAGARIDACEQVQSTTEFRSAGTATCILRPALTQHRCLEGHLDRCVQILSHCSCADR